MTASTVTEVRRAPAAADGAGAAVALLQAVSDPVRWSVLDVLAGGPACVCTIQEQVPVAANLLSYHLRALREAGLVTASRRGRWVDYRLADDAAERMRRALPGAVAGTDAAHLGAGRRLEVSVP